MRGADADGLVGLTHVERILVRGRVDRDRGETELTARPQHPDGDLPVRDESVCNGGPLDRLERDDALAGVHEILVLDQEASHAAGRVALDESWKVFMISISPTTSRASTSPSLTYGSASGLVRR